MKETNADLTTELARYKGQEKCFEFNQEKFVKLILKEKIAPIINQVDARVINFEKQFSKEATKFVVDFKSLAKEADESLDMNKFLEYENEHTLNLQTELERTKEKLETCIIKKENKYSKLWNDWYKKYEECKYYKISYDKAYNDMQLKIEQLQVQLGDLKGKSMNTQCESNTLDSLSQKLEDENVSLEFQVLNLAKENEHLKSIYQNLFDSIKQTQAQTKLKTDSLEEKLNDTIYENAKLRDQLFGMFFEQNDAMHESNAKTRRTLPRSNTKNDRVPSMSKSSCIKNKEVEVDEHHRNLLLSKNQKHMSSECNNIKLTIRNDKSKVVYAMCKQCLITANHDVCVLNYLNGMNSCDHNQSANVLNSKHHKKHKPKVKKSKRLGSRDRLASPRSRKSRSFLRWSPTRRIFNHYGKIIESSDSECYGDLQWGNILIVRVYFIEELGHNLFSVGQFCDSNPEVAFRRNTCFVRNLEGVDPLKGNRTTNLYTINLYEMASASPICLMARATSTKS
ncbi:hypothetical protein Tco_1475694 [Tanacetum coccineum]